MPPKQKHSRRIFRILAWSLLAALVFGAGTLVALNTASVQKYWVVRLLARQNIEAHFDEIHFDFLISDKISLRGASAVLPDGSRVRIEKFSARHNGTRGLFSGTPSFRDFSCEGFALDDARGRRQLGFSARARALEASFVPWAPIEKFTLGSPLSWTFSAQEFQLSVAGKTLAEGEVSGDFFGAEPLRLFGNVRGDFAALLAQPFFSKINNVAAGNFELRGQGNSAQLSLENLRSRYGEIEIPLIRFSAERGTGSTGTLCAEILCGEEKSSAEVHFSHLAFGEGQLIFSGEADAECVVVADVLRAGLLFRGWRDLPSPGKTPSVPVPGKTPNPEASPAKKLPAVSSGKTSAPKERPLVSEEKIQGAPAGKISPPPRSVTPKKAFWHGVSGEMDFCVKRVVFPENEIGEHRGRFSASDEFLKITCAVPSFFDGNAQGEAAMNFSKKSPHYTLSGALSAHAVELHRALPALRSRDPAPLEGRFDAQAGWLAAADLPENLERELTLRFDLKNVGDGRVRIFHADSKKMRLAGDILKIGGSLAGMLGGLTRNLEPRAATLAQSAELVKNFLTDFSYSEMRVAGNYRSGADLTCEHFSLCGNDLKIAGTAAARPIAGESPELWPLRLAAKAEVRGELAAALRVLGALPPAGTPDSEGFFAAREFEFSGTLKGSSEKFFENLMDAASGKNIYEGEDHRVPAENLLDIFAR